MRTLIISNNPAIFQYELQTGCQLEFVRGDARQTLWFTYQKLMSGWRLSMAHSILHQGSYYTVALREGRGDRLYLKDLMRLEIELERLQKPAAQSQRTSA